MAQVNALVTPFIDLLEARTGMVCAVGAGGKKSLLQRLASSHPGRVALTATVPMTYLPADLGFASAVDAADRLPARVAALREAARVAYACPSDKPGRHGGVPGATIERIHREGGFAATFVKADGARMRMVKAPKDGEPALPDGCTTLLAVVSARVIGKPLDERVAHRIERITEVTGLAEHGIVGTGHLARLVVHPEGLRKASAGRRFVPVINMVDDAAHEALAREVAETALALDAALERVVLTCLARTGDPVVAVVGRGPRSGG